MKTPAPWGRAAAGAAAALLALGLLAAGCNKPSGPPEKDPVHAGDGFSTRPGRGAAPAPASTPR
jgi:hypothetical protein